MEFLLNNKSNNSNCELYLAKTIWNGLKLCPNSFAVNSIIEKKKYVPTNRKVPNMVFDIFVLEICLNASNIT